MPSRGFELQHPRALIVLLGLLGGCALPQPGVRTVARRDLSATERVAHVLSRLTFGARSGDAERVASMGVGRWIDEQLRPETIADSVVVAALAPLPAWSRPVTELAQPSGTEYVMIVPRTNPTPDPMTGQVKFTELARVRTGIEVPDINPFFAGKIIRAERSERQLLEVVSDFWENHFSVFVGKMPSRDAIIAWDREVLRPRAFGRFRDLLGAVAHSPAMMYYLDNSESSKSGLNENYARELLELHTLGVDGGYTQNDVIDVARAFTGWTIVASRPPSVFVFRGAMHDSGAKTVLGHHLAAGRGIQDGEDVLDILARHPSTAAFIARKLAVRLVSDEPPAALVARAAATFTRTDGDIAEVVRTIVTSREFFARAAFRAKVKTPFELVISTRRALGALPDTFGVNARLLAQLGQPMFGRQSPDGWPEKGTAWVNSGTMLQRITLASNAANGKSPFPPIERWSGWASLSKASFNEQIDGVVKVVLGGIAEPATRRALEATRNDATVADDPPARLRALLALALGSPDFQRR